LKLGQYSGGGDTDNDRVAASVPNLTKHEILDGLTRLIERGHLTGNPIGAWPATGAVRVVNLKVTSAGLDALTW
jgi:hypothetical protein